MKIPLITFGEHATGPSFHLMTFGDTIISNKDSKIGRIGYFEKDYVEHFSQYKSLLEQDLAYFMGKPINTTEDSAK